MRHLLRLCILLLVLHSAPVAAGVVEDAEEELKKLRQGQVQDQTTPVYTPPPYPSRPTNTAAGPRTSSASSPTGAAPVPAATTGMDHRAAKMQSSPDEVEELSRRPRVITHEDKKGYFFSFLFIVLFAVLIALASLFGRRVETEE